MRILFVLVLACVLCGCTRTGPTLAGGQPIDHWVKALDDPDAAVRKTAATKLGNAGDPVAFPALQKALADLDADVRAEVILALVKFGTNAKSAIPKLIELQQRDPDAKVRDYAGRALQKIEGK